MATTKDSASARPSTSREQRGIELARERFEEIWRCGPWTWRVPSSSDPETVYVVTLRPERCPCEDHQRSGKTCKHLYAAWTVKAKTAPCAGCGQRFRHRDLHPVPADHLTFFEADQLCESCARAHGVL
jgi:hypothetical protein